MFTTILGYDLNTGRARRRKVHYSWFEKRCCNGSSFMVATSYPCFQMRSIHSHNTYLFLDFMRAKHLFFILGQAVVPTCCIATRFDMHVS